MQQIHAKMQESVSSLQDTDKDEEAETATNTSDNSIRLITEKLNENDKYTDKQINNVCSQENLNEPPSEGKC